MKKFKLFLNKHKKSSAVMISFSIHLFIVILAFSFVAFTVIEKKERVFEAPPQKRPAMKLKKLKIPVDMKKTQKKKVELKRRIVAKQKIDPKFSEIIMPDIIGDKGTSGYGSGGDSVSGSLGFNFEMPDLFGSNRKGAGNDFVGYFYDLKQTKKGELSEIGELLSMAKPSDWEDPLFKQAQDKYKIVVLSFLKSWNENELKPFYKAPREKFTKSFCIPPIYADEAPRAFGVQNEVKPSKWLIHYKGQIAAPETGRYRFFGRADDVLAVRVKKNLVLDAGIVKSNWESSDPNNYKFDMYNNFGVVIGDWIFLQKNNPVPMEVLIGEDPGGDFFCQLYIQKDEFNYPIKIESGYLERPVLPIFKTTNLNHEVIQQMKINSNWASSDGPNFGILK